MVFPLLHCSTVKSQPFNLYSKRIKQAKKKKEKKRIKQARTIMFIYNLISNYYIQVVTATEVFKRIFFKELPSPCVMYV